MTSTNGAHLQHKESDLGQRISDAVVHQFNLLKVKSGKPIVRSNGVNEWTVLAGMVAIDGDTIIPLTVSTGVKTLPDKVRNYSKGLFVHDLHAEILSLRLFNWWLLHEANNVSHSKVIEKDISGKHAFTIKSGIRFALYISEPPCGDASMGYISGDAIPWTERELKEPELNEPELKEPELNELNGSRKRAGDTAIPDPKRPKVKRGRGFYDQVGIVRTKPGRNDSLVSLSKSCSDKLCLKQLIGINNCFTSRLFPPIFLDYLVLRQDKFTDHDVERCFGRIEGNNVEILLYNTDDYQFHKPSTNEASPSPLSLLYVVPTKTVQVLNNGVRNGSFVKNKPPKAGGESIICNQALAAKYREIHPFQGTYSQFKQELEERQALKLSGKNTLGNWINSSEDDFDI